MVRLDPLARMARLGRSGRLARPARLAARLVPRGCRVLQARRGS